MKSARLNHTNYEYSGEELGNKITAWLNGARRTKESKEALARVVEIKKMLGYLVRDIKDGSSTEDLLVWERGLNQSLEHYSLHPDVTVHRKTRDWRISWYSSESEFKVIVTEKNLRYQFAESDAVLGLFELAKAGLVNRLRECANCQTWFYATHSTGKFCSGPCRVEWFGSSAEYKKQRRDYMKKYRRMTS